MRHEALSVPEGIDFDTQRRNLAQRRKNVSSTSLSDIPILPPVILDLVACSVLAGKEDDEAAFSIPRSHGRIEVEEEAPEWGRC